MESVCAGNHAAGPSCPPDAPEHAGKSPEPHLAEVEALRRRLVELERRLVRPDTAADTITASQQLLRRIAEGFPHVLWLASPDMDRILFVSQAYETVWGSSRASLCENPAAWLAAIVPEDQERVTEALGGKVAGKFAAEYRIRRPDGSIRWIRDLGCPIHDDAGQVACIAGIAEDITDARQAEEDLRAAHRQLLAIIDFLPDATFVIDQNGKVVAWNRAIEEMTGVQKEEILGKGNEAYAIPFYGAPRPLLIDLIGSSTQHLYERVERRGDTLCAEVYVPSLYGGRGAHIWITVSPLLDERGNRMGAIESIRDVTERKKTERALRESEERYRRIVETSLEGMWVIDADARTTFVNTRMAEMLGYTAEEMTGQPPFAFVDEREIPAARIVLDRCQQGIIGAHDVKFRRKDGNELWAVVSTSPILDEQGHYTGTLGMITDISDRRRAEEQARRHEAELAHVERLSTVGKMASVLAHELNQPLAAIVNYTQGCMQRLQSESWDRHELHAAMEQTAAQAERAGEIIRRIRRFVRKGVPEQSILDVNAAVRDAVEFAGPEAGRHGVAMQLTLAANLPPVRADKIQIEQVILNLVRNAFDAMQDAAPDVCGLSVSTSLTDEGSIRVAVRDSGQGLSEEAAARVFEAFFTTKRDGLGIGLAISRSIVEAHGGRLWIRPNTDRGVTFAFTLPAVTPSEEARP